MIPDGVFSTQEGGRQFSILEDYHITRRVLEADVDSKRSFIEGGYYQYIDPQSMFTFLSLNTVSFSHSKRNTVSEGDRQKQIDWFEQKLEQARTMERTVVIVGHIPAGRVGSHYDWEKDILDRYLDICTRYSDIIMLQVYGHHSKELIRAFSPSVSLLVSGGITPVGGRSPGDKDRDSVNPSFRYFKIEENYEITGSHLSGLMAA